MELVSSCWGESLEQACCWSGPGILGLVSARCWVELGPRISGHRYLIVPDLLHVPWYVGPASGPSPGQGLV